MPDAFKFIIYTSENVFSCRFHFIIKLMRIDDFIMDFHISKHIGNNESVQIYLRIENWEILGIPSTQHQARHQPKWKMENV